MLMNNKYNDLIGDMLERSGEKDNYQGPGKGKPFRKDYLQQDLFQNFQKVAKDAGFLPQWLKFQKEIASLIHSAETADDINMINAKIKKYNSICPPPMQKNQISLASLENAKKLW